MFETQFSAIHGREFERFFFLRYLELLVVAVVADLLVSMITQYHSCGMLRVSGGPAGLGLLFQGNKAFGLPSSRRAKCEPCNVSQLASPFGFICLNVMGLIPTTRFNHQIHGLYQYVLHFLFVIKVQNYCCSLYSYVDFHDHKIHHAL